MTPPAKPRARPATARAGGRGARSPGETRAAAKRPVEPTTKRGRPAAGPDGERRTVVLRLRLSPTEDAALRARAGRGDVSEYVRRALGLVDAPEGPGVAWELLSALRPEVVGAMVARYGIEAVADELERRAGSLRALLRRVRTAPRGA